MNLQLKATLPATTPLGPTSLAAQLELWDTPTDITRKLLAQADTRAGFFAWLDTIRLVEHIPVHAEDDPFNERPPISTQELCRTDLHKTEVREWLEQHNGWTIEWFMR
jgi:hypothetical protein